EALDGVEALAAAADFRPDVMLLDIGLPKLNGFDVFRQMRAEPRGRDMTIITLSGWGQDEDRRKFLETGFDHHLVKAVRYNTLLNLLSDSGDEPAGNGIAGD